MLGSERITRRFSMHCAIAIAPREKCTFYYLQSRKLQL
jgi:hypothetical protein